METPTIYVTEEVCSECPFHYTDRYDSNALHETIAAILRHHFVPECVLVAVARYKNKPRQEGLTCCATFYHLYGDQIFPIIAAQEAGNIKYFSTKDYESLEESHLLLHPTGDVYYQQTHTMELPDTFTEFYDTLEAVRKET